MGGAIAQELAINYPDRVGKLIIHASFCGPVKSIQPSMEVLNAMTNETGTAEDRIAKLHPIFFPEEWRNENPNYLESIPKTQRLFLIKHLVSISKPLPIGQVLAIN